MEFKDKKILIIGAGSGIGLATVKKYHQQKAKLFLISQNKENLKKIVDELDDPSIKYFAADISKITSLESIQKIMKQDQIKLDILVITAGVGKFGSHRDISEEEYDQVMNTNTKGTFFSIKLFSELIKNGGVIVVTSSFLASKYIPNTSILAASKIAVETFTKIFSLELSDRKIRINAISPGSIKTNFMSTANPTLEVQNKLIQNMPSIPIGKRGEAIQIAEAILFLTSEKSSYINGTILSIDGGISVA